MEEEMILTAADVDPNLLKMLDRGIDDVREGRTLSHREAMDAVKKLREQRRAERRQEPGQKWS